jgi:hypothetical protein
MMLKIFVSAAPTDDEIHISHRAVGRVMWRLFHLLKIWGRLFADSSRKEVDRENHGDSGGLGPKRRWTLRGVSITWLNALSRHAAIAAILA